MASPPDSEGQRIWETTFAQRLLAIIEIVVGSWILTALAGLLGLLAGFLWKIVQRDPSLNITVVLASSGIMLLPMLVVVAKVWEVNLSLFGNRAQAEQRPTAQERILPRGEYVRRD